MMVSRRASAGTPAWVWGVVGLCVATAAGAMYVGWRSRLADDDPSSPRMDAGTDARKPAMPSGAASAASPSARSQGATP